MQLNDRHITFIKDDIQRRGLVHDELVEELVDHFCFMVEERMQGGQRFFEAYQDAIRDFGAGKTLRQIQNRTIHIQQQPKIMLKNYFKTAWRNLQRHKFYSFINIFGLSIGIATSMLIMLFIVDELNYDSFHEDGKRIYRITSDIKFGGNDFSFPLSPAPMANTVRNEYPEISESVRIRMGGRFLVKSEDAVENFNVNQILYVDSGFFNMFSFKLIQGNPSTALQGVNKTAISESLAEKIFGTTDVIGKNVIYDGRSLMEITGVFEDFPTNSHFRSEALISMETVEDSFNQIWLSNNYFTYIKLIPGASSDDLLAKFPGLVDAYIGPQVKQMTGINYEEAKAKGDKVTYGLQALEDIHLTSKYPIELGNNGDIQYVYIFSAIAAFIILLACINFMNLATARSSTRAKEVGIRKVLGSIRGHLVRQFLTESIIITTIAMAIALGIASLALPFFNSLTGKELVMPFGNPLLYVGLIAVILILGALSGVYPSLFLSRFKPVQVLKGKILTSKTGAPVRSALVVFQFAITITLLLATAAVYKQLNYIQNKKLGFNKSQVILVQDAYMLGDQLQSFKNELLQKSEIESAGISSFLPVENSNRSDQVFWEEGKEINEDNMVSNQMWTVDEGYIPTLGLEIIEGRNFSSEFISDSLAIILNETAVKAFGLEDPIGSRIQSFSFINNEEERETYTLTVIGVVKDFHFNNMKQAISPLLFMYGESQGTVAIKFSTENISQVVDEVEEAWGNISEGTPFNYSFLDDEFDRMYRAEQRLGKIFILFATLATIIGGLGLFGLAAYLTEQRTKEIGIRKVLGASNEKILWLVSRDFGKLIIIAFVLAVPVSYYFISKWLLEFEYKTNVGWETYLIVGVGAVVIAGLTISYQTIHAALTNPADTIRNE